VEGKVETTFAQGQSAGGGREGLRKEEEIASYPNICQCNEHHKCNINCLANDWPLMDCSVPPLLFAWANQTQRKRNLIVGDYQMHLRNPAHPSWRYNRQAFKRVTCLGNTHINLIRLDYMDSSSDSLRCGTRICSWR
jgi:hypothetical protein